MGESLTLFLTKFSAFACPQGIKILFNVANFTEQVSKI